MLTDKCEPGGIVVERGIGPDGPRFRGMARFTCQADAAVRRILRRSNSTHEQNEDEETLHQCSSFRVA
jgi:hypothetical protein